VTELEQDAQKLEVGAGSVPTKTLTADQLNAAIEKIRKAAQWYQEADAES
jgi:hypothetical protein